MTVTIPSTVKISVKSNEKNVVWLINGIVYNNGNEPLLTPEAWLHFTKVMWSARNPAQKRNSCRISSTDSSKQTRLLDRD